MCKELSSSINALTYLSNRKHLESCKPWCCRYGQNRKAEIDISAEKLSLYGKGWLDPNLISNKITWRLLELISELKSKIRMLVTTDFSYSDSVSLPVSWVWIKCGRVDCLFTLLTQGQWSWNLKKRGYFFKRWSGEETVHLIAMRLITVSRLLTFG